jgi:hypothetical protein
VCARRRRPALRALQLFDAPALGGASESEQTAAAISPDNSEVAQTLQARCSACARPHSRATGGLLPSLHTRRWPCRLRPPTALWASCRLVSREECVPLVPRPPCCGVCEHTQMSADAPHIWRPPTSLHVLASTARLRQARFQAFKKLACWLLSHLACLDACHAQGPGVPGLPSEPALLDMPGVLTPAILLMHPACMARFTH